MAMRVRLIKQGKTWDNNETRLVRLVEEICKKAKFPHTIELGIFQSKTLNAFATGRSQKTSMIAVSSALIETMNDNELSAVLAHELSHIRSGDMVSMTLLQGTINSFVIFLSRIIAYAITQMGRGQKSNNRSGSYFSFYITTFITEIILMIPGLMLLAFVSRKREFKADASAARVTSPASMIGALKTLKLGAIASKKEALELKPYAAAMINKSQKSKFRFFATHPPIEERIKQLEALDV